MVVQEKGHAEGAVNRGSDVEIEGPEEVRTGMVPSAAKCRTWRAEMRCLKWDTKYSNLELRVTREMTARTLTSRLCNDIVGVGLVKRVNTLFGRNAQVVYELQVCEEMEGVRQEVREVKGEEKWRDQWRGRTAHIMSACGWDE